MRILHVIPSIAARDGGPSQAVIEMCHALSRRGHDAQIYTTNVDGDGLLDVPLGQAVHLRGVEVIYFSVNGGHYYKVSLSMAAALRENVSRFDAVHVHSLYQYPATVAAHYCRRQAVPYILQPHGSLNPYLYRRRALRKRLYEVLIERRNLAGAAAVQFTSAEEMKLAESLGLQFRGAVVPLGLDVEQTEGGIRDWTADAIWPELVARRVLLFLGRIHAVKALDVLAQAFGKVHRAYPDAHLVIAGPDTADHASQARRWLADEGVLDATTFTGLVTGDRKIALLKRADLFVLPSYSENFGIAVVEAMAAGLPVVISNRVNIWREIDSARAGLVVNPNASETTDAILALLHNPTRAREMGVRGARLAREAFSWRAAGDRLVDLYQTIRGGVLPVLARHEVIGGQ